jgi:hypothetical protein
MAQVVTWTFKVVDPALVPREYLIVDESRLRAICRGYCKAPVEIPGVEFVRESRTSVR